VAKLFCQDGFNYGKNQFAPSLGNNLPALLMK